jgi:hypothetical protein
MLGQIIETEWNAVDWVQLLQIWSPINFGKTVMDMSVTNGRKVAHAYTSDMV